MEKTPQEIVVWYVLPVVRKELAKAFLKKGIKQNEIASILGVTKAAVSQYIKSKRATNINLPEDIIKGIEASAERMIKNKAIKGYETQEIQTIINKITRSGFLCQLHREFSTTSEVCTICKSI